MRKCKTCKTPIPTYSKSETVYRKLGFCSEGCSIDHGMAAVRRKDQQRQSEARKAMAAERKAHRAAKAAQKERMKTRTEWLNEAQAVFNQYIRLRDSHLGCVSCGINTNDVQYHAGHYRTRKAAPQLRFDERQVFKQCSTCNNHLSGNLINYRRELLNRIGAAELERIETDNSQSKWTIDDARRIKAEYKDKIKHLQPQQ